MNISLHEHLYRFVENPRKGETIDHDPSALFQLRVKVDRLLLSWADICPLLTRLERLRQKNRRPEESCFFFNKELQRQHLAELGRLHSQLLFPEDFFKPQEQLAFRAWQNFLDDVQELYEALILSVIARRMVRGYQKLQKALHFLTQLTSHQIFKDLLALLQLPEEEVILVMLPSVGRGIRVLVQGVATVGQLSRLLEETLKEQVPEITWTEPTSGVTLHNQSEQEYDNLIQAYSLNAWPQFCTFVQGFAASEHWLWPETPLQKLERWEGERVMLVGPAVFPSHVRLQPRFPGLKAITEVVEIVDLPVGSHRSFPEPHAFTEATVTTSS